MDCVIELLLLIIICILCPPIGVAILCLVGAAIGLAIVAHVLGKTIELAVVIGALVYFAGKGVKDACLAAIVWVFIAIIKGRERES